jgi:hypothetical protein
MEDCHEDTPPEELVDLAHQNCLYLALRNMCNITRMMRPFDPGMELIQLDTEKVHEIRYMAFLRGRIPYINQGDLKELAQGLWGITSRKIQARELETFPGSAWFHGISCDAACSVLPVHMHEEIYRLGKLGGSRGFNKGDVWATAEEKNIVIDDIPRHPLESLDNVNEDEPMIPRPELGNQLPPIPPHKAMNTKQAECAYKIDTSKIWRSAKGSNGYSAAFERLAADARDPIYLIADEWVNRFQFMNYIVWQVSEGEMLLKDVCKGRDGMPSMLEVHKWLDLHPDFNRAMRAAERVQAAVFKDKAQEIVMACSDKDMVPVAKLQSNFFMKVAALQDEKFRDKQVIQTQDLDKRDERDLKRQLLNLLMANPDVIPLETIQGETVEKEEGASE